MRIVHLKSKFNMFYLLVAVFTVCYASIFEWILHKYLMHKPFLGFDYAFRAHALTHHVIFKADESYHLQNTADKNTIRMAWWNGPVLIFASNVPMILISWLSGDWLICAISILTIACYYGTYEYLHWCMHLPKPTKRIFEKGWVFKKINGHHLLHHRYPNKNLNVVLPFADTILGTLLIHSPVKFAQATGPSVPDVQPKHINV